MFAHLLACLGALNDSNYTQQSQVYRVARDKGGVQHSSPPRPPAYAPSATLLAPTRQHLRHENCKSNHIKEKRTAQCSNSVYPVEGKERNSIKYKTKYLSATLLSSYRYIITLRYFLVCLWRVIDSNRFKFDSVYSSACRFFSWECLIQHFDSYR